jgi:pimeloyl-ACP methyl ester carboxylesterase
MNDMAVIRERDTLRPALRDMGSGPSVVCVHASASSSAQWRALMTLLAPEYRVLAPDSYDVGESPRWTSDRNLTLRDEVALLAPVIEGAGAPVALVGHSYGGAVALLAAHLLRSRVRALVLYEPTLFSLVDAHTPPPNAADGIRRTVIDAGAALDRGDRDEAARNFIDYWIGPGAWQDTPEHRKPPIREAIVHVRRWGHALLREPTPLDAFRSLTVPVLYLLGRRSTDSARAVAQRLIPALPRVEVVEFSGLGHMGPVTHPDQVNPVIADFLRRTP